MTQTSGASAAPTDGLTGGLSSADASTSDDPSSADGSSSGARPVRVPRDWWDADWTRRHPIELVELGGVDGVDDFPIPVQLPAGLDPTALRFVTPGNEVLPHDVDGDTAWVSVDWDASDTTAFFLYAGNPAAELAESAAVWNQFAVVWHMDGSSDDATNNNVDGASAAVSTTPGVWSNARRFDSHHESMFVDEIDAAGMPLHGGWSMRFWLNTEDANIENWSRVVEHSEPERRVGWQVVLQPHGDQVQLAVILGRASQPRRFFSWPFDAEGWQHVSIELSEDEDSVAIRVDGKAVPTVLTTQGSGAFEDNIPTSACVGASITESNPLGAALDEFRMSEHNPSPAWLRAERKAGTEAVAAVGPGEFLQ